MIFIGPEEKKIKKLYKILNSVELEQEIVKPVMIKWMQDLNETIYLEEWERVWKVDLKMLRSVSLKENYYKMLHRWHLSPTKMAKIFPGTTNICWKCKENIGTYIHQWWYCKKAKCYWKKIQEIIKNITTKELELSPKIFLLNIIPTNIDKNNKHIMVNIITTARILFASYWKRTEIPNTSELINKIYELVEMDVLTDILRDQKGIKEIWLPFYTWLDQYKKGKKTRH